MTPSPEPVSRSGLGFALLAYGFWGFTPVYWKALEGVPALEITAHRVLWCLVFVMALLAVTGRLGEVRAALREPRERLALIASAGLIGANWLIFVWAVNQGQVLAASLGYYLNPLMNVLLGAAVLRERLRPAQWTAVALAALGVAAMVWELGGPPWVSLALGISFALYGLIRKLAPVASLPGLAVESLLLAPVALAFVVFAQSTGLGHAHAGAGGALALLAGAGLVTALPLGWFAAAARRLPLSTLGLVQYLAPTLNFVLALFVYGEPFTRVHAFTFGCIWSALALYSASALRAERALGTAAREGAGGAARRVGSSR